jgi:hypothetical protein
MNRRHVHTAEAELAYFAAATALQIGLDVDQLRALADLTREIADVKLAVETMRATARASSVVDKDTQSLRVYNATIETLKKVATGRDNSGRA